MPPKPLDKNLASQKEELHSFKEQVIEGMQQSITLTEATNIMDTTTKIQDTAGQQTHQTLTEENTIQISEEDQARIYQPWKFSLIIKLIGMRIQHHILKRKVQEVWKIPKNFPLIDLDADYYIAKFNCQEHMVKVLSFGPWFIFGHVLSIQRWKPNFVATEFKNSLTAIWIRLPRLPTEFYGEIVMAKIGNAIGKLLKVDACTSSTI